MVVFGVTGEVPEVIATELEGAPTVNTLFVYVIGGVISTVFPPLILNVFGDNKLKLGVDETV